MGFSQDMKATGQTDYKRPLATELGDVVTTPSTGMLAAMASASLGDDLAIRTLLTQPPCRVLVDSRAHVAAHFEEGGLGMSGVSIQTVRPSNARYLVLEDIVSRILVTNDVHKGPTRVISIENTAGGSVVPLAELRRIREWAGRSRVVVHMDGARLWEAVAAGRGGLRDYCTLCDLASLDFSRNLGAPMRAMVLGSAQLIARLRRIRKSIGGALRQSGPVAAAAQFAFMEQFGLGPWESRGKLRAVHLLAKQVETNLVWVDLDKADITLGLLFEEALKLRPNL
ncbi:pyridoxal phosphate-dependent transferase [Aspergillus nidulans var. acristatus]